MRCGPWQGWNHPYYGKESVSWRAKHSVSLWHFSALNFEKWSLYLREDFIWSVQRSSYSISLLISPSQSRILHGWTVHEILLWDVAQFSRVMENLNSQIMLALICHLYEHHSINALCVCDIIHWALLVGICRGKFEAVGLSRQGFTKVMGKPNR